MNEDIKIKLNRGRPTIYNEELLERVREYISQCEDNFDVVTGKVNLPSIEGLAFFLKINKDTIQEWKKKHQDFSVLIGELLAKQAKELINKGLSGQYSIFIYF